MASPADAPIDAGAGRANTDADDPTGGARGSSVGASNSSSQPSGDLADPDGGSVDTRGGSGGVTQVSGNGGAPAVGGSPNADGAPEAGGGGRAGVFPVPDAGSVEADGGGIAGAMGSGGLSGAEGEDAGPPPSTCTPIATSTTGAAGCFCLGAITAVGNTLYRQSSGIEVFDVFDPTSPVLLDTIDETGVSDGELVVHEGYLVSLANVLPTLNVYSLEDPTAPVLSGSTSLPDDATSSGHFDLATRDGVLAIAYQKGDTSSVLHLLSLDVDGNPSISTSFDVDGRVTSMTLAPGEAQVLVNVDDHQEVRKIDLSDGSVLAALDIEAQGVDGQNVREWHGDSFVTGGSTLDLVVVRWNGATGSIVGDWSHADVVSASALEFLEPGLLAVGSGAGGVNGRVSILDVFDPANPKLLGSTEAFRTEHLATENGVVYASGNDALHAIDPNCD